MWIHPSCWICNFVVLECGPASAQGRWLLIWQHRCNSIEATSLFLLQSNASFSLFWSRCTTQRERALQRQERKRKRRQAFLSQSSLCQSCKKAAKPIILSSSFFSGAGEASLDCHMYKGSPYKAIHSTEWTRHLWGFLISSSLFFPSFFKPCNQIWAKSNGGRIEGEQWGGGGFNESTFCWSETSK